MYSFPALPNFGPVKVLLPFYQAWAGMVQKVFLHFTIVTGIQLPKTGIQVLYGMPKAAAQLGAATDILPAGKIGKAISNYILANQSKR